MRPWMRMLGVGVIVGAALSVSLAGERSPDRLNPTPKKLSRPGQLEFFSRSGQAAQQASEFPTEVEVEALRDEASDAPKRFVRQKETTPATTSTVKKPLRRNLEAELFGDDADSTSRIAKPSSRQPPKSANTLKKNFESDDVELLPPPVADRAATVPTRRPSISTSSPESLQTDLAARTSSPTKQFVRERAKLDESDSANGVVEAGYQQKSSERAVIQPVRADLRKTSQF